MRDSHFQFYICLTLEMSEETPIIPEEVPNAPSVPEETPSVPEEVEEVQEVPYVEPQTYTFVLYDKQTTKSYAQFDADNLKPIILQIDPNCEIYALLSHLKTSPLEEKIDTSLFIVAKTKNGVGIFYDGFILE